MFTKDEVAKRSYEKAEKFRRDQAAQLKYAEKNGEEKPILGIAGNKNDQYENDNIVNEEEARNFANSVNGIFQLVSAKTGDNIENFFNMLINEYFKLNYPEKIQNIIGRRNSYQISYKKNKNTNNNNINGSNQVKKSKCC